MKTVDRATIDLLITALTKDATEIGGILAERDRQRAKGFGDDQDFDDVHTSREALQVEEANARDVCDRAAERGVVSWEHILREEVAEVLSASSPDDRYEELLQVAAVAVRWARAIRMRSLDPIVSWQVVGEDGTVRAIFPADRVEQARSAYREDREAGEKVTLRGRRRSAGR